MKPLLKLALGASLTAVPLISGMAMAGEACVKVPGYVTDCRGVIARTNNPALGINECWHTSEWTPEMAVVGCDGKVAEVAFVSTPRAIEPAAPIEPMPHEEHITLDSKALFASDSERFGFNKYRLTAAGMARLDAFSDRLRAFSQIDRVVVNGHTDRLGSSSYNNSLSLRRAEAVRDYLISSQNIYINQDVIETNGMGEDYPLPGATQMECPDGQSKRRLIECLARNRRVEIDIYGLGIPQE
jgi:OOP family OmpA-OmpF porin